MRRLSLWGLVLLGVCSHCRSSSLQHDELSETELYLEVLQTKWTELAGSSVASLPHDKGVGRQASAGFAKLDVYGNVDPHASTAHDEHPSDTADGFHASNVTQEEPGTLSSQEPFNGHKTTETTTAGSVSADPRTASNDDISLSTTVVRDSHDTQGVKSLKTFDLTRAAVVQSSEAPPLVSSGPSSSSSSMSSGNMSETTHMQNGLPDRLDEKDTLSKNHTFPNASVHVLHDTVVGPSKDQTFETSHTADDKTAEHLDESLPETLEPETQQQRPSGLSPPPLLPQSREHAWSSQSEVQELRASVAETERQGRFAMTEEQKKASSSQVLEKRRRPDTDADLKASTEQRDPRRSTSEHLTSQSEASPLPETPPTPGPSLASGINHSGSLSDARRVVTATVGTQLNPQQSDIAASAVTETSQPSVLTTEDSSSVISGGGKQSLPVNSTRPTRANTQLPFKTLTPHQETASSETKSLSDQEAKHRNESRRTPLRVTPLSADASPQVQEQLLTETPLGPERQDVAQPVDDEQGRKHSDVWLQHSNVPSAAVEDSPPHLAHSIEQPARDTATTAIQDIDAAALVKRANKTTKELPTETPNVQRHETQSYDARTQPLSQDFSDQQQLATDSEDASTTVMRSPLTVVVASQESSGDSALVLQRNVTTHQSVDPSNITRSSSTHAIVEGGTFHHVEVDTTALPSTHQDSSLGARNDSDNTTTPETGDHDEETSTREGSRPVSETLPLLEARPDDSLPSLSPSPRFSASNARLHNGTPVSRRDTSDRFEADTTIVPPRTGDTVVNPTHRDVSKVSLDHLAVPAEQKMPLPVDDVVVSSMSDPFEQRKYQTSSSVHDHNDHRLSEAQHAQHQASAAFPAPSHPVEKQSAAASVDPENHWHRSSKYFNTSTRSREAPPDTFVLMEAGISQLLSQAASVLEWCRTLAYNSGTFCRRIALQTHDAPIHVSQTTAWPLSLFSDYLKKPHSRAWHAAVVAGFTLAESSPLVWLVSQFRKSAATRPLEEAAEILQRIERATARDAKTAAALQERLERLSDQCHTTVLATDRLALMLEYLTLSITKLTDGHDSVLEVSDAPDDNQTEPSDVDSRLPLESSSYGHVHYITHQAAPLLRSTATTGSPASLRKLPSPKELDCPDHDQERDSTMKFTSMDTGALQSRYASRFVTPSKTQYQQHSVDSTGTGSDGVADQVPPQQILPLSNPPLSLSRAYAAPGPQFSSQAQPLPLSHVQAQESFHLKNSHPSYFLTRGTGGNAVPSPYELTHTSDVPRRNVTESMSSSSPMHGMFSKHAVAKPEIPGEVFSPAEELLHDRPSSSSEFPTVSPQSVAAAPLPPPFPYSQDMAARTPWV